MSIFLDFNSTWYLLFSAFFLSWTAILVIRRKNQGKSEIKEQVVLAFCGLFAMALMELFAVSTNLWHYTTGDWPVILWPTYLAAILFGYQLLRSIEGLFTSKSSLKSKLRSVQNQV
jgi:hypothetical protein